MCVGGSWVLGAPDSPPASGRLRRTRLCALSLLLVLSGVCARTRSDSSCLTGGCTGVCVPVHVRGWCVFLALNEPWARDCALISDPPPQIFHFPGIHRNRSTDETARHKPGVRPSHRHNVSEIGSASTERNCLDRRPKETAREASVWAMPPVGRPIALSCPWLHRELVFP